MLPPNQRNKKRTNRRTTTDFMAANSRTNEAELQKTIQHLDDSYRASQRRQRREMAELKKFMRQVKTVIHVEIPGERKDSIARKPLTRRRYILEKLKMKEAQEEERKKLLAEARRPSFANIGAVYAATSKSLQGTISTEMQQHLRDLDEIPEIEGVLQESNDSELESSMNDKSTQNNTFTRDDQSSAMDTNVPSIPKGSHAMGVKRTRQPKVSSLSSISAIPDLAATSSSGHIGRSVRHSTRSKVIGESFQQAYGRNHFLPPIEQTL